MLWKFPVQLVSPKPESLSRLEALPQRHMKFNSSREKKIEGNEVRLPLQWHETYEKPRLTAVCFYSSAQSEKRGEELIGSTTYNM